MNHAKVSVPATISECVERHDSDPTYGRRKGMKALLLGTIPWHRDLAVGLTVSVLLHIGLFVCPDPPSGPSKPVPMEPPPTLELMKFPVIETEEPDLSQVETIRAHLNPGMNLAPPTQADFPEFVPVDAFVQPVQVPVPSGAKIVATTKIFQGGWGVSDKFQVFDPAMLDKQAVPTWQLKPDYPEALRRLDIEGSAVVEFIVDTDGRVRDARCISATNPDFGLSAVYGVKKWKFRPGEKNGHPVNTRIRVPIMFLLPH